MDYLSCDGVDNPLLTGSGEEALRACECSPAAALGRMLAASNSLPREYCLFSGHVLQQGTFAQTIVNPLNGLTKTWDQTDSSKVGDQPTSVTCWKHNNRNIFL